MEEFAFEVKEGNKRKILLSALRGKKSFRRFKDEIYNLGILENYYAYYRVALSKVAIDWCEENDLSYQ